MANRTFVGTLVALAVVLVLVPLVGMLSMSGGAMGAGMSGGGMFGMHVGGFLWLILTIAVIAALVALLLRAETKV